MENKILKTELVEWEKLTLFQPSDLKKMSQKQLDKLKESFRKNGFKSPFYVWETKNKIYCLDGHTRIPILKLLKDEGEAVPDKLPANFVDCKNKKDAKKAVLIYNSHYADLQQDSLSDWISDLNLDELTNEIDIKGLELSMPIEETEADDEVSDDVPAITKLGDLWELGKHRVLCGDSTKVEDVESLMNGVKAYMVFTDPPYGMFLNADYSSMDSKFKGSGGGNKYDQVKGDNEDFKPELIKTVFDNFGYCKEVFLWGADYYSELLQNKNEGSWVVWDKRLDESADKMYGSTFELCWSKARHKRMLARIKWAGIFGMETQDTKKRVHPTQKPVDLVEWFFDYYSLKDKNKIVDLYLGSGSTLIASEKTGRICYGMELDEHYCDVIVNRYVDWCKANNKEYSVKLNGKDYVI